MDRFQSYDFVQAKERPSLSNSLLGKVRNPRRRANAEERGLELVSPDKAPAKTSRMPIKKDNMRRRPSQESTQTAADLEDPVMSSVTVKTNPLFHPPSTDQSRAAEEKPLFYGQRRNIRKTKEQEMITAIMELAKHGEKTMGPKKKRRSLLKKVKSIGSGASKELKRQKSPVRSRNTAAFHF